MKKKVSKKEMTVEDLAKIVDVGFKNVNKTIEELAGMTARGFRDLDIKLNKKIDDVEERLNHKIQGVERRIDDLALNRATREEVRIMDIRLTKLEKKVGISK
jgi:hypothetical protein